ncbi:MAG: GNAT family N-acetyltransferase [Proteobacteria bacterium]|nr:GNAT family N-acetyltransferase [Pseudomonadota bacterium]MBU0968138.1 GNAT family N-acetyltransferase [Pseudomonadota bacterium]
MPDLIVKLYELPEDRLLVAGLADAGIIIRRAMAYEKFQVVDWVGTHFSKGWAGECDVAFANNPISCFIATADGSIAGFACYDSTMKNFFGPVGVKENFRDKDIGTALLLRCLHSMAADGYAYGVIGGAGNVDFYARTVNAVEIPGSSPGVYRDKLQS